MLAPLALEAVKPIDAIFAVERDILAANERLAVRHKRTAPLVADFETWMREERAKLRQQTTAAADDICAARARGVPEAQALRF